MPRLESRGHRWLIELARWYESNWHLALEGAPHPSADSVLDLISPERKDIVRQVFDSIDSRYQGLVKERSQDAEDSASMETLDVTAPQLPPNPADDTPVTLDTAFATPKTDGSRKSSPSEYEELDLTIDQSPDSDLGSTQDRTAEGEFNDATKPGASIRVGSGGRNAANAPPDIPGYEIKDVLGRGGMGVVYLAHQRSIDRQVALKMILPRVQIDQATLDRFYAEVKAIGRFQHENIVRIYDAGDHQGMPYFSLEYVDGNSLAQQLDGKPMDPDNAARLLEPMARAMQVAHDAGVIHRDLKPANVLVTQEGVPKITDFGLAKELDNDQDLSQDGSVVGTPSFMSPEQAKGMREVGPLTDVYGLGAMLYCVLTGRPPFQGAKATETILQVINSEPIEPLRLQPSVPLDLNTICLKCLQKDPAQRYPDAKALADDLARYLRGEPIEARPISRAERVWRWCRRNPIIAAATSTAAVLGLIVMIGGPVSAAVIYEQKQEVTEAKEEAEENATLADKRATEATQARETADKFAESAAIQERNAVDALKSLIYRVNAQMVGKTNLIGLRKDLIQTVTNGLGRLDKNKDRERPETMLMAVTYFRLGEINLELGRYSRAVEEFDKCLVIFNKLAANAELPNAEQNLSKLYALLGDATRAAGDYEAAQSYCEQSLKIRRDWNKASQSAESIGLLAEALTRLGSLERILGHPDRARTLLDEAVEARENQFELDRTVANYYQLLNAKRVLAKAMFQQGDTTSGLELMTTTAGEIRKRAETFPNSWDTQYNSAAFQNDLAVMQLYLDRAETAAATFRQSVSDLSKLRKRSPNDALIQEDLEDAIYGLIVSTQKVGEPSEPELETRLLELRRSALQVDSDSVAIACRLAIALARCRKLEEGFPLAAEIRGAIETGDPSQYVLACSYAQLAAARQRLEANAKSIPDAIPSTVELKEIAISILEAEVENGFSRMTDLQRDPDLDPIRDTNEFQTVVEILDRRLSSSLGKETEVIENSGE